VEAFRASGDPLAVSIFEEAARELALLVTSVYRRVHDRITHRALVFQGGLVENNQWLSTAVAARLQDAYPEIALAKPLESATAGACLLAVGLVG
jgi:N-acetylglucosamine kinase-like BadF-type ATPase